MSGSRQKRSKAAASKQINAVTVLPDGLQHAVGH